jgi:hypothetical protein
MTTGQLIISLIMIWAAGIALGAAVIVRIAVRLLTKKQK